MSRRILTDVDGTVLHWLVGFVDWMRDVHHKPRLVAHQNTYDLSGTFGITQEELQCYIDEFFHSEAIATLPAEPCASTVLPELYRQGFSFVAITACPSTSFVVAARTTNLERVFGFPWEAVHCVGVHADKRPTLRRYAPAIWVEDHYKNAEAGIDCGHRSFLLTRSYNQDQVHPDVERVTDWHEIATRIV